MNIRIGYRFVNPSNNARWRVYEIVRDGLWRCVREDSGNIGDWYDYDIERMTPLARKST